MDEGAGDVEAVWLYQCRGGASVFRTGGHYVGFVVDLQGRGNVEGEHDKHISHLCTRTLGYGPSLRDLSRTRLHV